MQNNKRKKLINKVINKNQTHKWIYGGYMFAKKTFI